MKINEKVTIYYFSATGNSLKMAMDIASRFEQSEVLRIGTTIPVSHPESETVGFIFPVYMGGLPKIVSRFLQHFLFKKDMYYFSIGTYFTYTGNALSVVNKLLTDKGVALNYAAYLPSVGNCLKEYEVPQKKREQIYPRTEKIAAKIISDITCKREKKASVYCRLSDKIHKKLYAVFFDDAYRKFTLENHCNGCGTCEKICPVNNISMKDNRPQWGINCEACHACVHGCPKNAINLGKSKGRLQYRNPHIKRSMLINGIHQTQDV
jgi:ferredoxin